LPAPDVALHMDYAGEGRRAALQVFTVRGERLRRGLG
jgi:tRNA threonylcarbamoyladenosine biosynthesis protein TsaE